MFLEQRISRQANVETANAHINTEEKEVSVIVMSDTVVEPRWCTRRQGVTTNH